MARSNTIWLHTLKLYCINSAIRVLSDLMKLLFLFYKTFFTTLRSESMHDKLFEYDSFENRL